MAGSGAPNCVAAIAAVAGRNYITPEDVSKAFERYDPHMVRIDVLEVLGKKTEFGAEDASLCAFVAWEGKPSNNEVCGMDTPIFDDDGDPTDETLAAIEYMQPDFSEEGRDPWAKLTRFCRDAWNMNYGAITIREEAGEDGETLLCFITGGWSANEAVQGAMSRNLMFRAMRWHSSYRGGLVNPCPRIPPLRRAPRQPCARSGSSGRFGS